MKDAQFQIMPGGESDTSDQQNSDDSPKNPIRATLDILLTIVKIVVVVVILRLFIIQPFYVRGSSMEPTFHDGEYLIVQKLSYIFGQPKRGDVIVFHYPGQRNSCVRVSNYFERALEEFLDFFNTNQETKCVNYIKRVVALPGEKIDIREGKLFITNAAHPTGFALPESYTEPEIETLEDALGTHFEVPKNQYFTVGDNRIPGASADSRNWGYLPKDLILGKVFIQVFPLDQFGFTRQPKYGN